MLHCRECECFWSVRKMRIDWCNCNRNNKVERIRSDSLLRNKWHVSLALLVQKKVIFHQWKRVRKISWKVFGTRYTQERLLIRISLARKLLFPTIPKTSPEFYRIKYLLQVRPYRLGNLLSTLCTDSALLKNTTWTNLLPGNYRLQMWTIASRTCSHSIPGFLSMILTRYLKIHSNFRPHLRRMQHRCALENWLYHNQQQWMVFTPFCFVLLLGIRIRLTLRARIWYFRMDTIAFIWRPKSTATTRMLFYRASLCILIDTSSLIRIRSSQNASCDVNFERDAQLMAHPNAYFARSNQQRFDASRVTPSFVSNVIKAFILPTKSYAITHESVSHPIRLNPTRVSHWMRLNILYSVRSKKAFRLWQYRARNTRTQWWTFFAQYVIHHSVCSVKCLAITQPVRMERIDWLV